MANRNVRRGGAQRCSFCSRNQDQVNRLIAGPDGVFICDECVDLCKEILREEEIPGEAKSIFTGNILSPHEIYERLDQYVIGQDRAKKVLSVAVYNHYKRISSELNKDDVELQKSNILLIGPTGCGKTLLAQTLAKVLDVPFCIADATALTEAGYVGEDVENILLRLIQAADYDIAKAEKGIIYVDEIDKTARKTGDNPSITRDVSGEGVQQALLKIIEGTIASVPPKGGRKHPQQEFLHVDTTNILFICGGAFVGLDRIIQQRINIKTMGFGADVHNQNEKKLGEILAEIQPQDLIRFGMIPEFVGRMPIIATLNELEEEALIKILTQPKNSLVKQYQKLFEFEGVKLKFSQDALVAVAQKALARKSGARSLRAIFENVMLDIMYDLPSHEGLKECAINREVIVNNANPLLVFEQEADLA